MAIDHEMSVGGEYAYSTNYHMSPTASGDQRFSKEMGMDR